MLVLTLAEAASGTAIVALFVDRCWGVVDWRVCSLTSGGLFCCNCVARSCPGCCCRVSSLLGIVSGGAVEPPFESLLRVALTLLASTTSAATVLKGLPIPPQLVVDAVLLCADNVVAVGWLATSELTLTEQVLFEAVGERIWALG